MPYSQARLEPHAVVVGALVFICLYVIKLFFTPEITIQGDEFEKWYEVRRVTQGYWLTRLDHHTARFSLMGVAYLFQTVFGSKPLVYHLMMCFVYASTGLLAYLIYCELRFSTLLSLLSLAVVATVPSYTTYGAQFLPSPFSVLYLFATILFLLKLCKRPNSISLTCMVALCFFLAYGAKVTNLYWLPAVVGFVYVYIGRAATFRLLAFLAVLYVIEQIVNARILGEFSLFSRLDLMSFHHSVMEDKVYQPEDILGRWLMLPGVYLTFLVLSILLSIAVLLKKDKQDIVVLFAVMIVIYAVCLTFAITSIAPLKFAEPLRTRYFFPLALLCYLALPALVSNLFPTRPWVGILSLLGILAVNGPVMLSHHSMNAFTVNKYAALFDDHYQRGVWLLFTESKTARKYRAVYLSDQALFENGPEIPVFGKVYTAYFKEHGLHVPLAINLVRSPAVNEYVLVNRRTGMGELISFLPPKERQ